MDTSLQHSRPADHQRLTGLFLASLVVLWALIEGIDLDGVDDWLLPGRSLQVQLEREAPAQTPAEPAIIEPAAEPPVLSEPEPVDLITAEEPPATLQDDQVAQQTPDPPTSMPVTDQSSLPEDSIRLQTPAVSSAQILGSLSKYSLEEPDFEFLHQTEPFEASVPISRMISLTAEDVLASNLPRLPLADGELNIRFYPSGFTGAVQRNWDKITPEFGFSTAQGIKVKCKFLLAMVACGWE